MNNESSEIIQVLNSELNEYAKNPEVDLYLAEHREDIDTVPESFCNSLSNGMYRCGFDKSQEAYDEAIVELTETLDRLEGVLSKQRWLAGDQMTLADIRLFVKLI